MGAAKLSLAASRCSDLANGGELSDRSPTMGEAAFRWPTRAHEPRGNFVLSTPTQWELGS
jgi:hypothetical protein